MNKIDQYVDKLAKGIISRRGFMKQLIALGISVPAINGLLASPRCTAAEAPQYGGHLVAVHSAQSPSDTLDPAAAQAGIDACRDLQLYNPLVWVNEKLEPIPELAESWETKPGAKEWYFNLRKDVEFSNGKKLEAADVVYTVSRIIAENSKSAAKTLLKDITEIKADGKHTVKISLANGNMDLVNIFADYHTCILPAGHTDFTKPVGTGPFRLKEFVPGMRSLATRNPNYFKNGLPYVDEIEWFAITDSNARLNALLSGDVHMILELDTKALKRVKSTSGVKAVSTPAGQYIDFVMMCDRAPTDNPDLRLGLKYLIDRERVVKSVYKGYAQMGNDTVVPPSDRFYCDSIPTRPYDLDKAKYHLKKSGIKEIELHTAEACGVGATEQALMLQQAALKVDFKIDIKRDPSDGYWSSVWMKFPFHMSGWSAKPTSGIMLGICNKSDAPWNEGQWKNEKFDQLLVASQSETDYAKRKALYCDMQQLIYDTGGTIIPSFSNLIDGISEKVKGLIPVPLSGLGGLKFHETVWLS